MSEVMVGIKHVREAQRRYGGYCTKGVGVWLERYGMNLRQFLRVGYPASRFDEINDVFGNTVARIAREQAEGGV